ncbi:MAG: hypothetical protein JW770_08130 [Actinobacteria bacterium]|nr:hypothetical protein [Actinomycetota bacterium]
MGSYRELLEERKKWYRSINSVYCPILKEYVKFNSKGLHHLIYPNGKWRPRKEQMYKLGLLPLVIPVIKNAKKISNYEKYFVKNLNKKAEFWTLEGIVGKQKALVKVILRRVGTGNIIFFSVMKKREKKQIKN